MRTPASLLGALVVGSTPTLATLYTNARNLPTLYYDYVIVGGGTAGAVVANRLSEDPKVSVLLLEAGGINNSTVYMETPLLAPTLSGTAVDWNYTTTAQVGLNNRTTHYTRGKVLGGCSSVNYQIWNRGSKDDWNTYARTTGVSWWSWDSILPYVQKVERLVPSADGHDTTGQFTPATHGYNGIVPISLPGYAWQADKLVLETTNELSDEFPFREDMNGGDPIGVGYMQTAVGNGTRSSSATSYLASQYINRPNLAVLVNAQATKLISTSKKNGKAVFTAVDFAASSSAPSYRARVKREIIVSAGVFNTPHLLQLSGVGDKNLLKIHGIKSIVNLPSVGRNMSDHPIAGTWFIANLTDTFAQHIAADTLPKEMELWESTHTGALTVSIANQLAYLRLPKDDPIFKIYGDPSSGPNSAHYEFVFANGFLAPGTTPPPGQFFSIAPVLISPMSRGSVLLNSKDPWVLPTLDPNFVNHPFDVYTITQAFRAIKRFIAAEVWKGVIIQPYGSFANATTDEQIAAYMRSITGSISHATSTAAMSPVGASWGVTDPDLKVKGTIGLRVVDASVFPYVPSTHPQGPVYLLAERASDLIKASNN